jgi:hypothetical protein
MPAAGGTLKLKIAWPAAMTVAGRATSAALGWRGGYRLTFIA